MLSFVVSIVLTGATEMAMRGLSCNGVATVSLHLAGWIMYTNILTGKRARMSKSVEPTRSSQSAIWVKGGDHLGPLWQRDLR